MHVRNEEYGVFAAVADAYFTGTPVAVAEQLGAWCRPPFQRTDGCAQKRAPGIAIAGDVRNMGNDTSSLEEMILSVLPSRVPLHGSANNPAQAQSSSYGNTHLGHRERPHRALIPGISRRRTQWANRLMSVSPRPSVSSVRILT